jgi:hypothetical protein
MAPSGALFQSGRTKEGDMPAPSKPKPMTEIRM